MVRTSETRHYIKPSRPQSLNDLFENRLETLTEEDEKRLWRTIEGGSA
jgi:hypothetical protein